MYAIDKSVAIVFGMMIGLVCIFLGYRLFLKGIESSSSLVGEAPKIKLSLRNASPGLFFALYGTFIVTTGVFKEEIHSERIYKDGVLAVDSFVSKGSDQDDIQPNDNILLQKAIGMRSNGDRGGAMIVYDDILLIDSTNHLALNNLALLYLEERNFKTALELSKKALAYGEGTENVSHYYDTASRVLYEMKQYRDSEGYIEKAISIEPQNEAFRHFLEKIKEAQRK